MRNGISITVSRSDRRRLGTLVADRNAAQKHVWRAEIVLLTADGVGTNEIMRQTGKSKTCVWRWQERFMEEGFEGLLRDKTRPSRIEPLGADVAERVVALTLTDPPVESTHWTGAMMAEAIGVSVSSVQRIWRAHGLQPHRVCQFKLSNDPKFVDKLRDVVGLYVDPPAHAIVLSMDEKSQIQALDHTQPGLPLKKGRAGTMTHDYKRHGTTTLFAVLNILDGTVIGRNMQRHRHQEFIRFLNAIEAEVPRGKAVHVVLDNYAAHKHPKVRRWLDRHERFTPAGYAINDAGQLVAADWLKVIFNPSFPYRLVHMVLAAYLTTALVVGAVGAFHLSRDSRLDGPRVMFSMAMWMAALVAPIQIVAGDQHGLNTLEHQPAKVMAMEGHFQSHPNGAPLILFGLPDQRAGDVKYAIEIPKLSSLILKHSLDAPLAGLDTVPRENWPPVPVTFWSFRIMVGIGVLMLTLGVFSLWTRWQGTLYRSRWLHMFALAMGPVGLRTVESASPLAVASSLIAFIIVYFTVFSAGVIYLLRLMASPPRHGEEGPRGDAPMRVAGITPGTGVASGAMAHGQR